MMARAWIPGWGLAVTLALTGCQEVDFLYHHNPPPPEQVITRHKVVSLQGQSDVDVLWVIDNSGSMMAHQESVERNAQAFMENFMKTKSLRWKMGLLSTDEDDPAYVGMDPANPLDWKTPDPVRHFQAAVQRLGIDGDGIEKTFIPVENALNRYTQFLRPKGILALIIVTDAPEQSRRDATQFLDALKNFKGKLENVITYGVFGATDMGCKATDDPWQYAGSPYEQLVRGTAGKTFPICTTDFGVNLAKLGQDLVSRVVSPRLPLRVRPDMETIRVFHNGKELPGGAKEQGGYWIYDYELNSIVFHDLDFAPGDDEEVQVELIKDRGY